MEKYKKSESMETHFAATADGQRPAEPVAEGCQANARQPEQPVAGSRETNVGTSKAQTTLGNEVRNGNENSLYPEEKGFRTPPDHLHFRAKKLCGALGEIADGAIAYLQPGGGGPVRPHTHPHDHLFIVVEGEAKVLLGEEEKIIRPNEAFVVKGGIPHAVWNAAAGITVMIGITLKGE